MYNSRMKEECDLLLMISLIVRIMVMKNQKKSYTESGSRHRFLLSHCQRSEGAPLRLPLSSLVGAVSETSVEVHTP